VVRPAHPITITVVDLADRGAEAEAEARRWATVEADRPFDLTTGPLLRVTLIRLAPREHVLLVAVHHIAMDAGRGASPARGVVLYRAWKEGRGPALPELPVQYPDYAVCSATRARGAERDLAYWRTQLDGMELTELTTDRARQAVPGRRGDSLDIPVPDGVALGLLELCRREGVTMFMVTLAAFQLLISRYTGRRRCRSRYTGRRAEPDRAGGADRLLCQHARSAHRSRRPIRLPRAPRSRREGDPGCPRAPGAALRAAVEELNPARDPSRNPLVQIVFQTRELQHVALRPAPRGHHVRVARRELPDRRRPVVSTWAPSEVIDLDLDVRCSAPVPV